MAATTEQSRKPVERQAFSIAEFCDRWGICRRTCYDHIGSGLLETMKIGRRRVVTRDQEARWRERLLQRTQTGKC